MADKEYLIKQSTLQKLADAIRTKTGSSEPIAVASLEEAILSIPTAPDLVFDGVYDAETNKVATVQTVANEIAKVISGAPSSFDTLKEISDWLSTHENSAASMNSLIVALQQSIAELKTSKQDAASALKIGETSTTAFAGSRGVEVEQKAQQALEASNGKQDKLVSGQNIKTLNGVPLLGAGDIPVQPKLVDGGNIKTINGVSVLGSGNITKEDLGFGNVDNTSDTLKPVSIAQQDAIDKAKAQAKTEANAYTDAELSELSKAKQDKLSFDGTYNAESNKVATVETVTSGISTHNVSETAHNDIRLLIKALSDRLAALADSDDTTLDQMSEVVAYIKSNKDLIDGITTSKVSVTDIINDLVTNVANKPLSAAQGVVLKGLIDTLSKDKLNAADLAAAITTALAQAKASGEFDGADGAQGEQGANGYTPVKGVDYFTESDKEEIATAAAKKVDTSDFVSKTENETISGVKTFEVHTPSAIYDVAISHADWYDGSGGSAPGIYVGSDGGYATMFNFPSLGQTDEYGYIPQKTLATTDDIPDVSGKQNTLVSGKNIATINYKSLLAGGNIAVQPTLVSGTNIKTINSTSLLGSGDIAIEGFNPTYLGTFSGETGAWGAGNLSSPPETAKALMLVLRYADDYGVEYIKKTLISYLPRWKTSFIARAYFDITEEEIYNLSTGTPNGTLATENIYVEWNAGSTDLSYMSLLGLKQPISDISGLELRLYYL